MTLKELYNDIASVEIEIDAIPKSFMSDSYHKHMILHPSDEMNITLDCPNKTCTKQVIVLFQHDLQTAIDKAIHGNGTFEIRKQCDGWEDEKRKRAGMYHCNSDFILKGRVLKAQRNCGEA